MACFWDLPPEIVRHIVCHACDVDEHAVFPGLELTEVQIERLERIGRLGVVLDDITRAVLKAVSYLAMKMLQVSLANQAFSCSSTRLQRFLKHCDVWHQTSCSTDTTFARSD